MKVYAFPRGGIAVDDPTAPPKDSGAIAFLPAFSVIPLTQHSGGKVLPLVNVGDTVREGMLIGRSLGSGAVNVHATVPGKVIRMVSWKDSRGLINEALVIRLQGNFERLGRKEESFSWENKSGSELRQSIADYGVVEMEGLGMPAAEKLSGFNNAGEQGSLVVRCVFDDPWLAADYVLCGERLADVVEGSFIAARAGGIIKRIVFAVSHREKKLGEAMLAGAAGRGFPVSLALVSSRYPQRNRRELEMVLRNYEKKEGLSLGALLILGPATLAAMHDAVKFKRPPLDRYVAVGGSAIQNPQVMKVRIGKRISELFDECGGFVDKPVRIAVGTPFLGRAVTDMNEPITKTSYAVFALLRAQAGDHPERSCIGCGECRRVCPAGIDPEELYKYKTVNIGRQDLSPVKSRFSSVESRFPFGESAECHGCGCCEAVCPSHLPLLETILGEKGEGNV